MSSLAKLQEFYATAVKYNETYAHIYDYMVCHRCKRKYPDVVINVEGVVHHHKKPECFDRLNCNRYIRKQRRRRK